MWWVCAADEQLSRGKASGTYARDRDEDEDGRVVEGLRWVRDRHSHQLPITTGEDDRGFFDPPPGGMFWIASDDYVWKRVERVRSSPKHEANQPGRRLAYAQHVAEQDTLAVLQRAQRWLRRWGPSSGRQQ